MTPPSAEHMTYSTVSLFIEQNTEAVCEKLSEPHDVNTAVDSFKPSLKPFEKACV